MEKIIKKLEYSPDDLILPSLWREIAKINFPKFIQKRINKQSRKIFASRNDFIRQNVFERFGVYVGKYSYGYEPVCYKGTKIKEIGSFTSIAQNVNISIGEHDIDHISTHPFFYLKQFDFIEEDNIESLNLKNGLITIGHDVWIGRDVTILTNVHIGHGAVIAAGAVVVKDVPPYSIVGGVPAKIIRYRFDEDIIAELLNIKWWLWSDNKIQNNIELFRDTEKFIIENKLANR